MTEAIGRLRTWKQYRPKGLNQSEYLLAEVILFEFETYTEATARELTAKQPDTFRMTHWIRMIAVRGRPTNGWRKCFSTFESGIATANFALRPYG